MGAVTDGIAQGHGCPKCRRGVVSQEVWDERAAAVGLKWEGTVASTTEKVSARCLSCGYACDVAPSHVYSGQSCPSCKGFARVTQDVWDARGAAVGIGWAEPVKSTTQKAHARCVKCGYSWWTLPTNAQQGHGCPARSAAGFDPAAPSKVYLLLLPDEENTQNRRDRRGSDAA